MKKSKPAAAKFQSMVNELETLVTKIDQGDLDLDEMVSEVERGYELLKSMRSKLSDTKAKIEELTVNFETEASSTAGAESQS